MKTIKKVFQLLKEMVKVDIPFYLIPFILIGLILSYILKEVKDNDNQ